MEETEIVVTGFGIVCSLGDNPESVWLNLLNGLNGVRSIGSCHKELAGYGVHVLAPAVEVCVDNEIEDKNGSKHEQGIENACLCRNAGIKSAGIVPHIDTKRSNPGAIIGTGNALGVDYPFERFENRNPKWFLDTYPNILLSHLSIACGLSGYGMTIVNACTSSTQAIGMAAKMIKHGEANVIIAGGAESKFSPSFLSGFSRLNMHTPNTDPESAMRPFDKGRNGFVLGEGACLLVLENRRHAEKRGARPLVVISGYGVSMDAYRLTDTSSEGKARAMRAALQDAGISPNEIDYINTHGTSTQTNDREEAKAIYDVFGTYSCSIPANSTKSMVGHTMSVSGAIEAFVCARSLSEKIIHPTLNYVETNDEHVLSISSSCQRLQRARYCISNSSGIGGGNASLVFSAV